MMTGGRRTNCFRNLGRRQKGGTILLLGIPWGETIEVDATTDANYAITNLHVGGRDLGPINGKHLFVIDKDVVISAQCILQSAGVTVVVSPEGTGARAIGSG